MILAKSSKKEGNYITLSKHTKDVLDSFEIIKNKIPYELHIPIKIAILYHDFGKVIPKFQISVLGNKNYKPFDIINEIPHSIFSIFWIDEDKVREKINDEKIFDFIVSSVAYHHWRENFEKIISTSNEKLIKLIDKVLNEWKTEFEENLKNEFQNFEDFTNSLDSELVELVKEIKLNENRLREIRNGCYIYEYAIPPYKFDYYPLRETLTKSFENYKKWILISGFLQRCDHFASFCEEEGEDLSKIEINQIDFDLIKRKIKEKIKEDEDKIWQFEKVQNNLDKNVILIAPTGYGKTEFAFLWGGDNKFFYTLPLRSAVNQIFERATKIFDIDNFQRTGILHSDSDVYLLEKEEDIRDIIKLYDLAKSLSYPCIISTGDQFFPYALRPPGFEKIFSTFSYSKLIVDEIQAYDPKACAIIVSFIEWIYKMGGKFLLITATLPEFVKQEIIKRIEKNNFIEINIYEENKDNFKKIYKHKIKIQLIDNEKDSFDLKDDKIDKIIEQAKKGKRVLVILNTVKQAQNIYQKIKEKVNKENNNLKNKIFLLHSRFTIEDRRKKETELIEKEFKNPKPEIENEGKILIATQVVEASLDIDSDVLFTEICPLDSLIQRMGRVLRRYFYKDRKVINKSLNNKELNLDNDFKTYDLENQGQPNVYIWIFKNDLESGKGKVYHKELLKFSIAWILKKQVEKNITEIQLNIDNENKEEIIQKINEIFGFIKEQQNKEQQNQENTSNNKPKKTNKTQSDEKIYEFILNENGWLDQLKDKVVELSEYDKYLLVFNFYKLLPRDQNYLKEFYNTLEAVNSGYMSEKKIEAERIFREIYDLNVIPYNKLNLFKEKLKEFIESNKNSETKGLFTKFKKEVLSMFIVNLRLWYLKDFISEENRLAFKLYDFEELEINSEIGKRIINYCNNIFVVDYEYDNDKGLIVSKKVDKKDKNIDKVEGIDYII